MIILDYYCFFFCIHRIMFLELSLMVICMTGYLYYFGNNKITCPDQ